MTLPFASARLATIIARGMEWHRDWDALFRGHDEPSSATPRLGIDYIKASAPDTALPLRDGVSELRLHQDLARHGIAGVVWNCVRF